MKIIYPPPDVKDLREWIRHGADRAEIEAAIRGVGEYQPSAESDDRPVVEPVLVRLADVQPQPVQWLWHGRIALGKLTLIAGDPGLGKSFLTLDMASRTSTGAGWPDLPGQRFDPGGVVLLSAEDDLADTVRPRLDAAGADVSRIVALQAAEYHDRERGGKVQIPITLSDLSALEATVRRMPDCRLVAVDPISAYLGGADSHKNADVRAVLAPLSELAGRYRVAVVAVTHLRKGEGPAIYRAMGSLAFAAAARSVWTVAKDTRQADGQRRLFLPVKNNLGNDKTGLAFTLRSSGIGAPSLAWERDPVETGADEALSVNVGGDERSERSDAAAWLREILSEGQVSTGELRGLARDGGFSWPTIRRALNEIGARAGHQGFGKGSNCYWALAGHTCAIDAIDAQPVGVSEYGKGEQL